MLPAVGMCRVICVADTSALVNLRRLKDSVIANKSILDWLWDEVDIHISDTVREEIRDSGLLTRLHSHNDVLRRKKRRALETIAGKSLGRFHAPELSLVALGVKLFLRSDSQVRHVVFLCDDIDALDDGRPLFHALPAFCFWTTADFVLYLALRLGGREDADNRQFHEALDRYIAHMAEGVLKMADSPARQAGTKKWSDFKEKYKRRLQAVLEGSRVNW